MICQIPTPVEFALINKISDVSKFYSCPFPLNPIGKEHHAMAIVNRTMAIIYLFILYIYVYIYMFFDLNTGLNIPIDGCYG